MQDTATVPRKPDDGSPARQPLVDDELADQLPGKAAAEGVELLGSDGLLSQVTQSGAGAGAGGGDDRSPGL